MPRFEASQTLQRGLEEVFDFFRRPANLPRISPPELHMKLVEGPELLELGSRIVVQGRRFGLSQTVASEVVSFQAGVLFADEQRQGPFRKFLHTHRFEAHPDGGTRVFDLVDFEPPGGMLGFVLTADAILRDLRWIFDYRNQRLLELLG